MDRHRCLGHLRRSAVGNIQAIHVKTTHMRGPQVPMQKGREGEQSHEDDHDRLAKAGNVGRCGHGFIVICEKAVGLHPAMGPSQPKGMGAHG